jgi:hypothetical protein
MNKPDEIYVGKVIMRSSGTKSGIKQFNSRKNQMTIQANSHIAKTNMFNTPGESFSLDNPNNQEIIQVFTGILTLTGISMLIGFYLRR